MGMDVTLSIQDLMSARDAVGKCLGDLGAKYDTMVVITADVDGSSRIGQFKGE